MAAQPSPKVPEIHIQNKQNPLEITKRFSPQDWDNLVNYQSSRCRAAAQAFIPFLETRHGQSFKALLTRELEAFSSFVGFGTLSIGPCIIIPECGKRLGILLLQDRLADKIALQDILQGPTIKADHVLFSYKGDWWSNFPPNSDPVISLGENIKLWIWQRRTMAFAPSSAPTLSLTLKQLTSEEIVEALQIAKMGAAELDIEIKHNSEDQELIKTKIMQIGSLLKDLEQYRKCKDL
ncbi:hypothetical protein FA15DRAFT_710351 [Coprinopsis marcescibilis]|uniref:Uncharacterized protein n=1 Tax=Coprinopsis marcescibilis TaxID=230819 RepID=A0A5C3KDT7_COPMA|nr:hypothetical protein FA15DRAFT_710351 [Coprinopsis marcescibilis]